MLHITQPTLSRQMAQLEDEPGTQLFIRGRHLTLTDAGIMLRRRAEEVVSLMGKIEDEIVKTHDVHLDSEYVQWLHDIKERYRGTQIKAAVKVNSEQLLFNWELGRDMVTRKSEEK